MPSPCNDFSRLEDAIRRSTLLAACVCAVLLAITIASLGFAVSTVGGARDAAARMPVLVVPGAVGGVYTPGLTEDSVRAAARYLAGLGTQWGSIRGFDERFDELETFASPRYLPQLQAARSSLRREVETQNQARSFFAAPAAERLHQAEPGRFEYAVGGERIVYASGLPMDRRNSVVSLQLLLGAPSARNRSGIMLEGFQVTDTAPPGAHADATAPSRAAP